MSEPAADLITIQQLEAAINRCTHANPANGVAISSEARILADIYGTLIFLGLSAIDSNNVARYGLNQDRHGAALTRWVVAV